MRKVTLLLAIALLCGALCGCTGKDAVQTNVQTAQDYLLIESPEDRLLTLAPKVQVLGDARAQEPLTQKAGTLAAYVQLEATLQPVCSNCQVVDAQKNYVALRYDYENVYTRAVGMGPMEGQAIFYFNRKGQITRLQFVQGHDALQQMLQQRTEAGVGLQVAQDGCTVQAVHSGSPADAAGIRVGDVIVAVGDAPVADMNVALQEIDYRLRGVALTRVRVTLQRAGRNFDVTMQRIGGMD